MKAKSQQSPIGCSSLKISNTTFNVFLEFSQRSLFFRIGFFFDEPLKVGGLLKKFLDSGIYVISIKVRLSFFTGREF